MSCQNCGEIGERLKGVETSLNMLCKDLLDNGQPGRLTKHENRMAAHEERTSQIENWRSYVNGALVVIAFLLATSVTIGGVLLAAKLKAGN